MNAATTPNPPLSPDYWERAKAELSAADPVMAGIIADYPQGKLECRGQPFETLCRSIVGQQISVKAADSMWAKLEVLCEMHYSPDAMLEHSDEALRGCGLSRQKIAYLRNIALFFNEDSARLSHGHWHAMDDDEIIKQLVSIKGVGRWTAEMFLIFHVMHPDVFPVGDIGVQKAVELHYTTEGFIEMKPAKDKLAAMEAFSERWEPWRTVASWYLWRSLDPVPVAY